MFNFNLYLLPRIVKYEYKIKVYDSSIVSKVTTAIKHGIV